MTVNEYLGSRAHSRQERESTFLYRRQLRALAHRPGPRVPSTNVRRAMLTRNVFADCTHLVNAESARGTHQLFIDLAHVLSVGDFRVSPPVPVVRGVR